MLYAVGRPSITLWLAAQEILTLNSARSFSSDITEFRELGFSVGYGVAVYCSLPDPSYKSWDSILTSRLVRDSELRRAPPEVTGCLANKFRPSRSL